MPGRKRAATWVVERAESLLHLHYKPSEVMRLLEKDDRWSVDRVDLRTIQRWATDNPGNAWSLGSLLLLRNPPIVLSALNFVIRFSKGRRLYITEEEARLVDQINAVAPDAPVHLLWRFAGEFLNRAKSKVDTHDLDYWFSRWNQWQSWNKDELVEHWAIHSFYWQERPLPVPREFAPPDFSTFRLEFKPQAEIELNRLGGHGSLSAVTYLLPPPETDFVLEPGDIRLHPRRIQQAILEKHNG